MQEEPSPKRLAHNAFEVPSSDAESGPMSRRHRVTTESSRVRLSPVLELLLPTVTICILLWIGALKYTGRFYGFVKSNQASTQIVVQVVSQVLAMLQVSSVARY